MDARRTFLKAGAALGAAVASWPLPRALAAPDPARVALVIGNDRYPQAPLRNATNDARAIGKLLEEAGFQVDLRIDAPRAALVQAADDFGRAIGRGEVKLAFFYYAGHGAQVDWRNYLLPVDARVASAADLPGQCLDLGAVLAQIAKWRDKTFVLILDACRDDPFGGAFRPEQKGLSQFDAPVGTVLAFSTAPGNVAADGGGTNGLYTENLVRELAVKGTRIEDAFKRVRLNVRLASKGAQIPWESTSLESDVYLFPTAEKLSEDELEKRFQEELATWNRIKTSKSTDDWAGYLRAYPRGKFTEIAQTRLNVLLAEIERQRAPKPGSATSAPTRFFEIRAGVPVPDFYGAKQNPGSAGTYALDRRYTVGDQATFAVLDPISGVRQRVATGVVTKVDLDGDRVEWGNGEIITDLMGNPLKFGPATFDVPAQNVPAVLQVGNRWESRFQRREPDGRVGHVDLKMQVARRERVKAPAGEFDTFHIYGHGYNRGTNREVELKMWVVPGLNVSVRFEQWVRRGGAVVFAEARDLVALRQHYIPFERS
jgi:hypothetical protein